MGELGALFNPGMRHELEERRARAARREEEGNARDGDLRIDLDSGVAVINAQDDAPAELSGDEESATSERSADGGTDSTADSPAPGSGSTDSAAAAPSAGQQAQPADATPPPLRPRGKRAVAASKR